MTAIAEGRQDLTTRDPRPGDRMDFRGTAWKVTERASYDNEEGYHCVEWTCEAGGTEGYLLKEEQPDGSAKWFFTLTIDEGEVRVLGGPEIVDWFKKNGAAAAPPPVLHYRAQDYRYADKTEGMYENDEGRRERKTLWDYWDGPHRDNLAVEIWEDGEIDAYLGRYIQAGDAVLKARPNAFADHDAFSSIVLKSAAYVAFMAFVLLAQFGGAVDMILTFSLGVAVLAGWLYPVLDSPAVAAASAATAGALGALFWSFPPFTSLVGLAAFLAAPTALALYLRREAHTLSDEAARVHVAYALELPLIAVGLVHYFRFAPAPHDFVQYCLALAPAAAGGAVSWAIGAFVFSPWGPSGPQSPQPHVVIR